MGAWKWYYESVYVLRPVPRIGLTAEAFQDALDAGRPIVLVFEDPALRHKITAAIYDAEIRRVVHQHRVAVFWYDPRCSRPGEVRRCLKSVGVDIVLPDYYAYSAVVIKPSEHPTAEIVTDFSTDAPLLAAVQDASNSETAAGWRWLCR
jgi:hypothetical protein